MATKYINLICILVFLTTLLLPSCGFIDSPLDWAFASSHTRGLVCPSLRYSCCSDLRTWRHGSPCEHPKGTSDPEACYKRKEWACCQAEDDRFTYTMGFQKDGKDEQYGRRSGTREDYLGIGKGALKQEEKQALGRTD